MGFSLPSRKIVTAMTKVEITIQEINGKPTVTWLEQNGDQLPDNVWSNLNVAIKKAVEG